MDTHLMSVERAAERARDDAERSNECDLDWCPVEREFNSILDCLEEVEAEARRRVKQGHREFETIARDLDHVFWQVKDMLKDWQAAEDEVKGAL